MSKSADIWIPGQHQAEKGITDYNTIELHPEDDSTVKQAKLEQWIGARIGTRLVKLYPNTNWKVHVDIDNGMVVVSNPDVSSLRGYHISLERSIEEIEAMMSKVGGEILERGRLARRGLTQDQVDSRERNLRDEVIDLDNS